MQFLAPLWLALGAAVAVPLLLHLWKRRSGQRVIFPAVRFLAAATEARGAAVRWREWLLLALRVLALAALALAAARPSTVGVVGRVGARVPGALALVLDNSLSTTAVVDGRPVLDALRTELQTALAATQPGDRVWLITADGAVAAGTPSTIRSALGAVQPLTSAGDLPAALRRAVALTLGATGTAANGTAGAQRGPAGVILATDAQATTWARQVTLPSVRLGVVRARGPAPPDHGVVALAAQPADWHPEGTIVGQLSAASDWRLTLRDTAGRVAADTRGTASAADSFGVRVPLRPALRGWLIGTLELLPDELRGDDRRHLAVFVGAPPQLVADPSAGPFAALAIATLASARTPGSSPALSSPSTTPSIISVTEPSATTRLPAVLIAPADAARFPAVNRALERLGVPWRLEGPIPAPATAAVPPQPGAPTQLVPVSRRWRLVARTAGESPAAVAADTLASVGGDPWIVAGNDYVLLASPLDTGWTALPTRAAFLPWLTASANRLTGTGRTGGDLARSGPQLVAPGAPVLAPVGVDALVGPAEPPQTEPQQGSAAANPGATPPDGAPAAMRALSRPVRDRQLTAPREPGVYFWQRAGARVGALVVDPEAEEVVLTRLDAKELAARVRTRSGGAVRVTESGANAAAFAFGAGGERSLTPVLATAALLLLVGEAFAGRARTAGQVS